MALKETLVFLKELKSNNHKEWFDEHRKRYKDLKASFEEFIAYLIEHIASFDDQLAGVDPKKCIFRINRDIRFSKDKSPYKTNFGALIGPNGKKSEGTSYYIHIEPGNSFVGAGVYMPPPDKLAAIRQEIDYNLADLHKIINAKNFKSMFGEIMGDKLKTAPKGYPKDHPAIDLLRLKSFYVVRYFKDNEIKEEAFKKEAIKTYKEGSKFNGFLNHALS